MADTRLGCVKFAVLVFIEIAALFCAALWNYAQASVSARPPPAASGWLGELPPSALGASLASNHTAARLSAIHSAPRGEALPIAGLAAPWLRTPPAPGAILIDRHLHKNGGSTMRQILLANERAGVCQYWGYWQTPAGWNGVMAELRRSLLDAERPPDKLPWLCIEAHASATTANFMPVVVPFVVELRARLAALAVPTRVLLVTRVREPLSYYLSFYKWKVAGIQREQRGGHEYGSSFLEWAPHNLQAWSLLNGGIDTIAGPLGSLARPRARAFGAREMRALSSKLAHFDIVAPLEYFDEHLLMIADAIGLPLISHSAVAPPHMGLKKGERLSDALVCPNMTRCRERVRAIAPWDAQLYSAARATFRSQLAAQPRSFHRRLRLFRASRAPAQQEGRVCCARQGKCHDKATGAWLAQPLPCVPGWRALQNLVIDDRGGVCCMSPRARAGAGRARRRRAQVRLR